MGVSISLPDLYERKENIQEDIDIPRINKVIADDMNIIKELLENTAYVDNENLKNKNGNVLNPIIPKYEDALKELTKSIPGHRKMTVDNFEWDVVEYPDGFFEASVKIDANRNLNENYGYNNSQFWVQTEAIKFPFKCEETPQVQVSAGSNGQLFDVSVATISTLQIALFLYCEVKLQNQPTYISVFVRGNKAKNSEVSE